MKISSKSWKSYIDRLSKIDKKAAAAFADWLREHPDAETEDLLNYAYYTSDYYGNAASELACEMYDEVAVASGKIIPPAEPARTATYGEVAKAVMGKLLTTQDPDAVGSVVGTKVKTVGLDTLLNNSLRDGAEFAWVPSGDTCAFCIMLASNGWQRASKKALKNGHAEHVHNNCDCTYAIRFDKDTEVEGYDPEYYRELYDNADGKRWKDKVNSMRRDHYAANKEKIRFQQNAAYEKRRQLSFDPNTREIIKRGKDISVQRTTDGKYNILVSERATLKKQGLENIEKAVDDSLKKIGVPDGKKLPQIIVLADDEMGTVFASYNYIDNRLFVRASMGDKRKTIYNQMKMGYAAPNDPNSTARHELIHWLDAEEYREKNKTITIENYSEYLKYLNEKGIIELNKAGVGENNVYKISRYAEERYKLRNDYDEAYTEYRTLKWGGD